MASSGSTSGTGTAAIPPAKHIALQGVEKAMSNSGRSSPAPEQTNEGIHQRNMSTMSTATFNSNAGTLNGLTLGGIGSTLNSTGATLHRQQTHTKDPKARAKSREYLKQCLQEISYLTSASSLNPLPERAPPASTGASGSIRPKKIMTDSVPPAWGGENSGTTMTSGAMRRQRSQDAARGATGKVANSANNRGLQLFEEPLVERDEEAGTLQDAGDLEQIPSEEQIGAAIGDENVLENTEKGLSLNKDSLVVEEQGSGSDNSSSSSGRSETLSNLSSQEEHSSQSSSEEERQRGSMGFDDDDERQQVTAFFRPGGKLPDNDDWAKLRNVGQREREKRDRERNLNKQNGEGDQAQLQATSDRVAQLMRANPNRSGKADEEDLANLTLVNEHDEETSRLAAEAVAEGQMWKSKRVLRSHLDAVRAVVFDHHELSLYSGSDDNTIKFWKLDPSTFKQSASKAPSGQNSGDTDPILTLRGHSAAVTCLAISTSKRRLYSGSVDSSILVWKLIDGNSNEPYPPFDSSLELTRLVGHTQAIWDLCLLPTKMDGEGLLASASADGTVKFWTAVDGNQQSSLLLSFDYFGLDPSLEKEEERAKIIEENKSLPVPTSIAPCMSDLRKCAISYSNCIVKLFEVETGKEVMQIQSDENYDQTVATQINKVLTHPTLPILITGHENNYIKFFDINTGMCTLSMVGHLDSVTCLDIDPSGLTLASGGHDCSVRYWDYDNEKNTAVCVQEVTAHRKKSLTSEGILAVKYHPTAPWFCSAGADGVIRVYG